MNTKEAALMAEILERQLTKEEADLILKLLRECFYYLNDEQRKLAAKINLKIEGIK